MDTKNLESCNICKEIYSNVVPPRSIPCGHSMCESCIRKSTTRRVFKCPNCRKTFSSKSTKNFPINYGMQALILEMRKSNYGTNPKRQSGNAPFETHSNSIWQALFNCQVNSLKSLINNGESQEDKLLTYKAFLQKQKNDHLGLKEKISDIVSQQNEMITQLDNEEKRLSNEIACGRKNIETAANELKNCEKATQELIDACAKVMKCCQTFEENNSKSSCDKVMKCCQTFEEQNLKIQKLPNAEVFQQTTAAQNIKSLQDDLRKSSHCAASSSSMPLMDAVHKIVGEPTMSVLISMEQPIEELLKKDHLDAIQNEQGRIASSRISSAEGKIQNEQGRISSARVSPAEGKIYHLKDEEPPASATTIQVVQESTASLNTKSLQDYLRKSSHCSASSSSMPLMDDDVHKIVGDPAVSVSSLISMEQPTKELLKKGDLDAIQNEQGRISSSRISSAEGKIQNEQGRISSARISPAEGKIYHLKDEEPPVSATTRQVVQQNTAALNTKWLQDVFRKSSHCAASSSSVPLMDAVQKIVGEPAMSVSSLISTEQPTKELLKKAHLDAIHNDQGRISSSRIISAKGKIQNEQGIISSARINPAEGKIYHYLKDEKPPVYATTIQQTTAALNTKSLQDDLRKSSDCATSSSSVPLMDAVQNIVGESAMSVKKHTKKLLKEGHLDAIQNKQWRISSSRISYAEGRSHRQGRISSARISSAEGKIYQYLND